MSVLYRVGFFFLTCVFLFTPVPRLHNVSNVSKDSLRPSVYGTSLLRQSFLLLISLLGIPCSFLPKPMLFPQLHCSQFHFVGFFNSASFLVLKSGSLAQSCRIPLFLAAPTLSLCLSLENTTALSCPYDSTVPSSSWKPDML